MAPFRSNLVLRHPAERKGREPRRPQIRVLRIRSRGCVENLHWRGGNEARDTFFCDQHGLYSTAVATGALVALDQDRREQP